MRGCWQGGGEDCGEKDGRKEPSSGRCAEGTRASSIRSVDKKEGATEGEDETLDGWLVHREGGGEETASRCTKIQKKWCNGGASIR